MLKSYSSPTNLLKCSRAIISHILSEILNTSIKSGIYPANLKIAKIIPVYKGEDETDASNYRPILSIFNRIFEKIVYKRMVSYIEKQILLYSSQYGFRKGHSTQHAILELLNDIQTNMNKASRTREQLAELTTSRGD
jgi:hypothetical protein